MGNEIIELPERKPSATALTGRSSGRTALTERQMDMVVEGPVAGA